MEVDSISQQAKPSIDQIDKADVIVGLLADFAGDNVAAVCDALRSLHGEPRIVVLQNNSQPEQVSPVPCDGTEPSARLSVVPWSLQNSNAAATPVESVSAAYESIFATAQKLDARVCCVIASKFEDSAPLWISRLAAPVLADGFDLVAPYYAHRKVDGLLNSGIVSPLMRSLYGRRIQNPMGPDIGVSGQLFREVLAANQRGSVSQSGLHLLASLVPEACCDGDFQVCQAYLGKRVYPPADWTNLSSLLAEILGPVFLNMERNAARWQRIRGSTPVSGSDSPLCTSQPNDPLEIGKLLNSFQLGARNLEEIWSVVLPTATLFELRRLARVPPEQFRMADELWARIVYDFALAHRLRTINRDHLLKSLTPLYLGWVASYARDVENADPSAVGRRLERLSLAYETEKPYLISRWRWPDRFNP